MNDEINPVVHLNKLCALLDEKLKEYNAIALPFRTLRESLTRVETSSNADKENQDTEMGEREDVAQIREKFRFFSEKINSKEVATLKEEIDHLREEIAKMEETLEIPHNSSGSPYFSFPGH